MYVQYHITVTESIHKTAPSQKSLQPYPRQLLLFPGLGMDVNELKIEPRSPHVQHTMKKVMQWS